MKKAVLISVRPEWCQKIASGEKTIEVRKNRPKLAPPFKCYIYCTRDKHLAFMQNQMGANLIACMDAETAILVGGFIGNGKIIGARKYGSTRRREIPSAGVSPIW